MKKTILVIVLTINVFIGYGQFEIGQTKAYIINKNEDCRIDLNEEPLLVFNCSDLVRFFAFDENTHLCTLIGVEFNKTYYSELKNSFIEYGYNLIEKRDMPIFLSPTSTGRLNETSPAEIYTNATYMVSFLQYDLIGDANSDKFCIYVEFKKN